MAPLGVLLALRLSRRWNQTGQKWAGETDVARGFLPAHTTLLWVLVGSTYLYNATSFFMRVPTWDHRMLAVPCYLVTTLVAARFKLSFTNEDAPELMSTSIQRLVSPPESGSLLSLAQSSFVGMLAILVYVVGRQVYPDNRPPERRARTRTGMVTDSSICNLSE